MRIERFKNAFATTSSSTTIDCADEIEIKRGDVYFFFSSFLRVFGFAFAIIVVFGFFCFCFIRGCKMRVVLSNKESREIK